MYIHIYIYIHTCIQKKKAREGMYWKVQDMGLPPGQYKDRCGRINMGPHVSISLSLCLYICIYIYTSIYLYLSFEVSHLKPQL